MPSKKISISPTTLSTFFLNFAHLLEIRGDPNDRYPILAYKRAAETFQEYEEQIDELIKTHKLSSLPGIGKAIESKVHELIDNGKSREYEELKMEVPESLLDVLRVRFLGPKRVAQLYLSLGIKDLTSLKKALSDGSALSLPGIKEASISKWQKGMEELSNADRIPRSKATPIVRKLVNTLKKCPTIGKIEVAGSYRRKEKTVGDIDILITARDPKKAANFIVGLPNVDRTLGKGSTKVSVMLKNGLQIDVRMIDPSSFGAALQYFTGNKQHNVKLRTIAKAKGLKISEYGVFRGKQKIAGKTEESVYKAIGLPLIAPGKRLGKQEIEENLKNRRLSYLQ